jgi:predicted transcriptional regulator
MPKAKVPRPPRTSDVRRLFVSEADVVAAQRLLSVLSAGNELPDSGTRARSGSDDRTNHRGALEQAQIALGLRQRRVRIFGGGSLSSEPPFALLLALYVHQQHEPVVTQTRLTQLAWLSQSTAIRWLEHLVDQGWIVKDDDVGDRRKSLLSLSAKGREALDDLFGWADSSDNP